jgi:molybdenum cofactor cytidylyltransferase
MTTSKSVASLFVKEPMHWGLRGDPYLWREMSAHFEQMPLPDAADELISLIETTFEVLTTHSISEREMFFMERFSHEGMSSGHISPDFWRETGIPMMRDRYFEAKSTTDD